MPKNVIRAFGVFNKAICFVFIAAALIARADGNSTDMIFWLLLAIYANTLTLTD